MLVPVNMIYWLHEIINFAALTSHSSTPFQKCCERGQFLDADTQECVSAKYNENLPNFVKSVLHLNSSKFSIYSKFPCQKCQIRFSETYLSILNFFQNGDAKAQFDNEVTPPVLKSGQYCIDVMVCSKDLLAENETIQYRQILMTYDQLCVFRFLGLRLLFLFFFSISILLIVTTLILYLAKPELRIKVKDKCFICFLGFLVVKLLSAVWTTSHQWFSPNDDVPLYVSGYLWMYACMGTFCWLNVMCIHLWRSVTSIYPISSRSFHVYTIYALGLPVICLILRQVDHFISGSNHLDQLKNGDIFSDPTYLYFWNVLAIQQIINVFLFSRVGYFIWSQKKKWNGNGDLVGKRRFGQQKTVFFQLLRLFVIMGLDWTFFLIGYHFQIKRTHKNITLILSRISLCPGYLIFINYVCCDKQVISTLRKTFPKLMNILTCKRASPPLDIQDTTSTLVIAESLIKLEEVQG